MRERNGAIDVQKFYYAWVICVFHIFNSMDKAHMKGAATAVEFFILVSGVFFFQGWFRKREKIEGGGQRLEYPLQNMKRRILRFMPYTTIGIMADVILRYTIVPLRHGNALSVGYYVDMLLGHIWDVFLISMNGMNCSASMLDAPLWTLSAMVLVVFFILCLLVTKENFFLKIFLPISLLCGYGFYGNLDGLGTQDFVGFTTFGVLRVYLVFGISYYIYLAAKKMSSKEFTRLGSVVLSVVEVGCHLLFLVLTEYRHSRSERWFATMLFAIALIITLSRKSSLSRWCKQSRVTDFLGECSIAIYIIHGPIQALLRTIWVPMEVYYQRIPFVMLITFFASLLTMWLGKWVERSFPVFLAHVKSWMCKDPVEV